MYNNECVGTASDTTTVIRRVGYAYVPYQTLGRVYTPERALIQGTIFPELDIKLDEYERGLYDGK